MSQTIKTFNGDNFQQLCQQLASQDADLASVIERFGYPPRWHRPNSFESLIHIILEQQVSLASAKAALDKLRQKLGDVTPQALLSLDDDELKACYFSRQKTVYARGLAQALVGGQLDLVSLPGLADDEVRQQLVSLKGIGNWTVDIYLIMVLQRSDIFPFGDLAVLNALKQLKQLPTQTPAAELLAITDSWRPYRTIATMILWHFYLSASAKTKRSALS